MLKTTITQDAGVGQFRRAGAFGTLVDVIGEVRHRELAELRARFNPPSHGGWGILFDPGACRWIAVRGKQMALYAGTAAELRDRIMSRLWATFR
jgi:hypothetical protein